MAYIKAVSIAVVASLVLGAVGGAGEAFLAAIRKLRPEDGQVVLAHATSVAMNNAALFVLLFVPLAMVLVFVGRRWRRRSSPGEAR